MKKLGILIITIILALSFVGCTKTEKENTSQTDANKNPLAGKAMPSFNAKDIDGNSVTEEIFKNYDVTMVNIWGTFCGPCITEMPDINKLQNEFKDKKVNIIGLVGDANLHEAKRIIGETKVSYINIIPDENLENNIVKSFPYVPATIFVNSKGEIVEEFAGGSKSFEEYKSMIEDILNKNK